VFHGIIAALLPHVLVSSDRFSCQKNILQYQQHITNFVNIKKTTQPSSIEQNHKQARERKRNLKCKQSKYSKKRNKTIRRRVGG
jgi:hypothetical protein